MTLESILATAAAILISLGGAGAILLALSGYLGKLWADRLMARDRASHEQHLERLRAELEATNATNIERLRAELVAANEKKLAGLSASLELTKMKLIGAHTDKITLYRIVVDIVAEMIADITAAPQGVGGFAENQLLSRIHRFDRERMRAYGFLAMFAPQHVMDAFDRVTYSQRLRVVLHTISAALGTSQSKC